MKSPYLNCSLIEFFSICFLHNFLFLLSKKYNIHTHRASKRRKEKAGHRTSYKLYFSFSSRNEILSFFCKNKVCVHKERKKKRERERERRKTKEFEYKEKQRYLTIKTNIILFILAPFKHLMVMVMKDSEENSFGAFGREIPSPKNK